MPLIWIKHSFRMCTVQCTCSYWLLLHPILFVLTQMRIHINVSMGFLMQPIRLSLPYKMNSTSDNRRDVFTQFTHISFRFPLLLFCLAFRFAKWNKLAGITWAQCEWLTRKFVANLISWIILIGFLRCLPYSACIICPTKTPIHDKQFRRRRRTNKRSRRRRRRRQKPTEQIHFQLKIKLN